MNKSLKYIALLAILPLFTVGITTGSFTDAEALKGKGVSSSKYGSSTNICGLQLCSEIPGGKEAWMAEQGKSKPVTPVSEPSEMMEKESMKEEITEADLGSVLRLSRANVPATIPMHQGYYGGGDVYSTHPKTLQYIKNDAMLINDS
ncbi:blue copper domain-containing protein [Marine Group I thaumarchaeote SCGC AAA799-B03]|uniref:Blue copper domain-containing protein n=1 Tax=Marine Group I thaumarchaeote SCGC AAA799-B03 TaxID=1502289 RepID=A0A087S681_9ARCH|nr:blue copper domain-containing protein [Marine Group I thaumarchaeote SCGC AAA799-B03]